MEWFFEWFQGFFGWFTSLVEGFVGWLVPALQGGWPSVVDMVGIILQNPETIALGLGSGVIVILIGLLVGTSITRSMDRRAADETDDEEVFDTEIDSTPDGDAVDLNTDRNEIFRS